jgi:DNA repair protein RadA/Sms
VLQRRAGVPVGATDVYASTVGGVRLTEPATDLAVAMAVAGSARDEALATGLIAIGEVGLAGEIRRVTGTARRLSEAARLGFTHALVPRDPGKVPDGIEAIEVVNVEHALAVGFPGAEVIRFASRRH